MKKYVKKTKYRKDVYGGFTNVKGVFRGRPRVEIEKEDCQKGSPVLKDERNKN